VGTGSVDQVRLRIPAAERLLADDRGLPTATAPVAGTEFDFTEGRLIGVTRLDTAFTGLRRDSDGRARVNVDHPDDDHGVTLWVDERFGYLMVFTGDTLPPGEQRTAVAVEPMSCPPDALRSGTALSVLRPGARWTGSWGISPR
jgi:aldose 1-epimerase